MHATSIQRLLARLTIALGSAGTALCASAAPIYLIDATTDMNPPDPGFANVAFSLTYEDYDLNQLFTLDELLAFTGYADGNGNYFPQLLEAPTVPGQIGGTGSAWEFSDGNTSARFAPETFTPFTQQVGSNGVPAPAPLILAAGALPWVLRKRRQAG